MRTREWANARMGCEKDSFAGHLGCYMSQPGETGVYVEWKLVDKVVSDGYNSKLAFGLTGVLVYSFFC
jgi:hypothetical protein